MDPQQALILALDPAEVLRCQGIAPDPWQQQLLLCPHRQVLLNCSRQAGKSRAVSALAVHTAVFQPGSLTLLLSPSLRQSLELFRKVMEGYNALGRPLKLVQDAQTKLELANGSRVVCLPGREETIRSFGNVALLVIDEAARVPDDLYRSIRPMLAISHGRLICLSTPFGQRGFFYDEWTEGGTAWHRVRIPWQECPRITEDFIAQERRSMGASWVEQEYNCSFESLEGLVYPDFERCGVDMCIHTRPTLGGIDFGFRNPFAALWAANDRDGVLWILGERYEREKSIYEHTEHLPGEVLYYADPSGAQEIAALRKMNFKVRKGCNDIRAGIAAVRARLETGRLKVVRHQCPNLFAEARLYRYPTKADGRAESEVPLDEHNHALAALRYLVSRLDDQFIKQYRRKTKRSEGVEEHDPAETHEAVFGAKVNSLTPWLSVHNDSLWTDL